MSISSSPSSHSATVILARVSSKSQEDEGYSLDAQLKLLTSYCEVKNLTVVKIFKIAETASKEHSRKVFQELLAYLIENNVYHLTVEKTDRFTRNFRDAVAIDDWLEQNEQRYLHAVKENLLLHKNAKSDIKFMWNIHLSVAKKYTDNLREEAMKGWAEKLAQGWLPSVPPPGYVTVSLHGKRIHIPDPKTKALILRAFKLYLDPNQSISSVAIEMDKMGIRTRQGRPYAKSKVQKMLTNPFYIGINHFNDKDYPGAQETFISESLFKQVQQKLRRGRPVVLAKHNPVFKGLITCQDCNGLITWQRQKERFYGGCQRLSKACQGRKFLREDKVEEIIVAHLDKLVCPSPDVIDWVCEQKRREHKDDIESRERLVASISTQLTRLELMDSRLYDDKLAGDITKERYEEKHAIFEAQIKDLVQKKTEAEGGANSTLEGSISILKLSQKAATIYIKKTPEQKRVIITKLFSSISSRDGIISVTYTDFAKAIAEKVEITHQILGGEK